MTQDRATVTCPTCGSRHECISTTPVDAAPAEAVRATSRQGREARSSRDGRCAWTPAEVQIGLGISPDEFRFMLETGEVELNADGRVEQDQLRNLLSGVRS